MPLPPWRSRYRIRILDHICKEPASPQRSHTISQWWHDWRYLARKGEPATGKLVTWRGFSRLTDIHFGFILGAGLVGN